MGGGGGEGLSLLTPCPDYSLLLLHFCQLMFFLNPTQVPSHNNTPFPFVAHTLCLSPVLALPVVLQVVRKNSRVLLICAIGGTLDTNVSYRRDKKLFAGADMCICTVTDLSSCVKDILMSWHIL